MPKGITSASLKKKKRVESIEAHACSVENNKIKYDTIKQNLSPPPNKHMTPPFFKYNY